MPCSEFKVSDKADKELDLPRRPNRAVEEFAFSLLYFHFIEVFQLFSIQGFTQPGIVSEV